MIFHFSMQSDFLCFSRTKSDEEIHCLILSSSTPMTNLDVEDISKEGDVNDPVVTEFWAGLMDEVNPGQSTIQADTDDSQHELHFRRERRREEHSVARCFRGPRRGWRTVGSRGVYDRRSQTRESGEREFRGQGLSNSAEFQMARPIYVEARDKKSKMGRCPNYVPLSSEEEVVNYDRGSTVGVPMRR